MTATANERQKYKHRLRAKKRVTHAESLAKSILEREGIGFKFQIIVGFYIIDFLILEKMLIVELDGEYHQTPRQKWYDKQRDLFLEACGFTVLRLTNDQAQHIVARINDYLVIDDWEKKYRYSLMRGNVLKDRLQRLQAKNKDQTRLV